MLKYALITVTMLFCQAVYSADFQDLATRLTSQGDILTKAAADKASAGEMKNLAKVIAGHDDIGFAASPSPELDLAYKQIIRSRLTRTFLGDYYKGDAKKAVVVKASFSLVGSRDYQTVINHLSKQGDILADAIAAQASDAELARIADVVAEEMGTLSVDATDRDVAYQQILRIKALRGLVSDYFPKSEAKAILVEACLASISG